MATISLAFQNPVDPQSTYLLETLLEQSIDAVRGGAAYAWATQRGISLLLDDPVFEDFLRSGSFELIVGVDSVTTPLALGALTAAEAKFPGLSVRAFMSQPGEGLFHPKLAWFDYPQCGSLIVGSGNLTGGGLWDNREAYTLSELDKDLIVGVQRQWAAWRTVNAERMYRVSDARVLERAEQNRARGGRTIERRAAIGTAPSASSALVILEDRRTVLIAEIPRSGDRWSQVNFHKNDYEEFFGAQVGTQRRMLFRGVDEDGNLGEVENNRPSVEVASRNWRFELSAANGLRYPDNGRPIGVYLRLKARTFVYMLSMPGDRVHQELVGYLASTPGQSGQMRSRRAHASEVGNLMSVRRLIDAGEDAFSDEVPD